jgi:hypothetical protein
MLGIGQVMVEKVSWVTENRTGHEELAEMGFGTGCSELSLLK